MQDKTVSHYTHHIPTSQVSLSDMLSSCDIFSRNSLE